MKTFNQNTKHQVRSAKYKFAPSSIISLSHYLIISLFFFGLSSCFKEKLIKAPSNEGAGQTNIIPMHGPGYVDQFFFSLATNTVVSSNSRFAYDLMFDCNASTFHIWLNSAKFMCVADVGIAELDTVTMRDTIGHNFNYERGAYSIDSSAMGDWRTAASILSNSPQPNSNGHVYIINLGVDTSGRSFGFIKMLVTNFVGNSYSILCSTMDNQNTNIFQITKDPTRNYVYFSFNQGIVPGIEPDKGQWDLCFTHYTTVFYLPGPFPYQVTGVLTNPSKEEVYLDSTLVFDSIRIKNFNPNRLQSQRDVIGWDWKVYSGTYHVKPQFTYFISAGNNVYYKFHFVGYYLNGVEGYPTIQYSQL